MEKIAELLKELAVQLGVTVEYLWAVSVKQSYIIAVYFGVMGVAFFAATVIMYRLSLQAQGDKKSHWDYISPKDWRRVLTALCAFTALILLMECLVRLLNPEYYALARILEAF